MRFVSLTGEADRELGQNPVTDVIEEGRNNVDDRCSDISPVMSEVAGEVSSVDMDSQSESDVGSSDDDGVSDSSEHEDTIEREDTIELCNVLKYTNHDEDHLGDEKSPKVSRVWGYDGDDDGV